MHLLHCFGNSKFILFELLCYLVALIAILVSENVNEGRTLLEETQGEGRELWLASKPETFCFSLKIMPQLLNHLQVDSLGESIDWGTLVVYTCADNCGGGNEYLEEFIWKQDFCAGSI